MNIAKAMKVKNRLVGEINTLKNIFQRENSCRLGQETAINIEQVFDKISSKEEELIKVKTAIQKASVDIAPELVEIAELKAQKAFFECFHIQARIVTEGFGEYQRDVEYISWLTQEGRDLLVTGLQEKINTLQDRIDDFNASTQVEL